jgi:FkbM family methyltransferase
MPSMGSSTELIQNIANTDGLPQAHQNFLWSLKNQLGFEPTVVYDIGCCVLHWTRVAEKVWPNAKYVVFDAFEPASFLYSEYDHHVGVLSDSDSRTVKFYQNDTCFTGNSYYRELGMDGLGQTFPEDSYLVKPCRTLDSIVRERGFPPPDLVKIDVQGAETDILKGALETLSSTKVLIVEMQHMNYNDGAPTVETTKPFIESLGWTCIAEQFSKNSADSDYAFVRNFFT